MSKCKHMNFKVENIVNRLTDDNGEVTDFHMDVNVQCDDCDMPFRFKGLPPGLSGEKPSTCIVGQQGRFPLEPVDGCLRMKSKMPGYSVSVTTSD